MESSSFSSLLLATTIDGEVGLIEPRPRRVIPPLNLKDCFIPFSELTIEKELGNGNFGTVYMGHIRSMKVAVKKSLNGTNDESFKKEAEVMHKLSHQRIVRFLGFCCDAPDGRFYIITEYMSKGSLLNYLKSPEGRALTYGQLISIIDQVRSIQFHLLHNLFVRSFSKEQIGYNS